MSKTSSVTVIANKAGQVISVSPNNPTYGWVAVESVQPTFSEGFMRLGKRVAFIAGTITDLEGFGFTEGQQLPGKIVVKETLQPINADKPELGIKYPNAAAKEQNLACMVDDEPVYRKSYYTTNEDTADVLVAHTNGDEIREFMKAQQALAAKAQSPALGAAGKRAVVGAGKR